MRRFSIFLAPLALLFALNLAACGNKGPLVRASDAEQMEEAEVEEDVDVDGDVADDDVHAVSSSVSTWLCCRAG